MPFRSQHTLEAWLEEFQALGYETVGSVRVMHQDGDEGADTGLVGVTLAHASTVTYIQPEADGSDRWVITWEGREEPMTLDAGGAMLLANEISKISALCAFLQAKSATVAADVRDEE